MKLTKCSNNHFFDADKYSECPHCLKTKNKQSEEVVKSESAVKSESVLSLQDPSVEPKSIKPSSIKNIFTKGKTIDMFSGVVQNLSNTPLNNQGSNKNDDVQLQENKVVEKVDDSKDSVSPKENIQENVQQSASVNQKVAEESSSLQAAIKQARESTSFDPDKTRGFSAAKGNEPVVGWLVFITGEYVGVSFSLKTGRNCIGRAGNMDVVLAKDLSVSRERHAIITFEPKKRKFYIQPGDGSGLTYLNEELLFAPSELKGREVIQIGDSSCMFIPFCGEEFGWEDYIKKG